MGGTDGAAGAQHALIKMEGIHIFCGCLLARLLPARYPVARCFTPRIHRKNL